MRTYGRSSTSQIIQTANWASVSTGGLRSARYSSERKQFAIHSLGACRDSYFFGRARTIVFGTINFGKLAILIAIRLASRRESSFAAGRPLGSLSKYT